MVRIDQLKYAGLPIERSTNIQCYTKPCFQMTEEPNTSVIKSTLEKEDARPWVRFWARMFDLMVFGVLFVGGFSFFFPIQALGISDTVFTIVITILWIFVESILLSVWGTTPGKLLFKIKLQKLDGAPIRISDAFLRCLRVAFWGLAVGIPLVIILTALRAHERLSSDGATSWDRDGGFTVDHQRIGSSRIALIVFILVVFSSVPFVGYMLNL